MASIYDWSTVNATNATADADLTWAEGQAASTVNNSARQMMVRGKEFVTDIGGSLTVAGTANAITMTAQSSFTTLANGRIVSFKAASSNSGAVTLNVNSIGAKAVVKMTASGEAPLIANEIKANGIYLVMYSAALAAGVGAWLLLNPSPVLDGYFQTGMILDYVTGSAPPGWLNCGGQAVSRTTYAALFGTIGTFYGAGDGSTTFNLPDLRGRVVAGIDDMGGVAANRLSGPGSGVAGNVLGASGGAENIVLTIGQIPSHAHGVNDPGHQHTANAFTGSTGGAGGGIQVANITANESPTGRISINTVGTGISIQANGGGAGHVNVQPTIVLYKIIKT